MSQGLTATLSDSALLVIKTERNRAIIQHGPLKPGPQRWVRLLAEEWEEAQDELMTLDALLHSPKGATISELQQIRGRAIAELAQLAQLAIGIIEHLQQGKVEEEA